MARRCLERPRNLNARPILRHRGTVLEGILAHERPQPRDRRGRHSRQVDTGNPFPLHEPDFGREALLWWQTPRLRVAGGEEGAEGGHGVGHDGNAGFGLLPEENPHHVVLAVLELVAAGADDVGDDGEDAETEERAQSDFAPDVDPHAPEEEDGD